MGPHSNAWWVVSRNWFIVVGTNSAEQGSKPISLTSCKLSSSVEGSGSKDNEVQIDVDCEVSTFVLIDLSNSRMVKIKQTACKGANYNEDRDGGKQPWQGILARFPHKGKPTEKAASHMATYNKDKDFTPLEGGSSAEGATSNANLQQALKAGRHRHTFGGKAQIYKRAPGKRRFKPGIGALKEIAFYQWEYEKDCECTSV